MPACAKEHVLFCFLLTRAIVAKRSHNKLCNWHADSSRRTVVQLSRERTAPRISSWTSLKCYIHFSFILKLIIVIYKQLKRPVAFSVVHFWIFKTVLDHKASMHNHPCKSLTKCLTVSWIWTIPIKNITWCKKCPSIVQCSFTMPLFWTISTFPMNFEWFSKVSLSLQKKHLSEKHAY